MKLQVSNITKSFGEKQVLKGISFQAESGKAIGILGRNGAGKTTSIRIIMGVFPPDDGDILIDGSPIHRRKLKIGYLPEERGLYPKKIIIDQLIYLGCLAGMKKQEARKNAEYWLSKLEMSEYTNKKLDTLSKGNQQKIQLVATLITNPDIVILDEPFSGLDPVNAMLLKDIVKELINDKKIVLFSSHQMNYIEEFCNDIAIINDGNIVLQGSISEIKRNYDRRKIVISSFDCALIKKYIDENLKDIVSSCTLKNGLLFANLISPETDFKNKLISALSSQKFDIDAIKVFEPSLNDIFVEYTGGGK